MSCTLNFHYLTSLGESGDVSFDVPDGSYQSAYVFYADSPYRYQARTDGSQGTINLSQFYYPPTGFTVVYSNFSNSCPAPTSKYDCVNGMCVPNVNGFYASLSDCQINCGKQGCSGQCVSSSDWAQIEGLISQLKNRSCG